MSMNPNSVNPPHSSYGNQFRDWANSPQLTRFWERARERKWLYLVAGVLIGTLLILALQRLMWRRPYVVPVAPMPSATVPLTRPLTRDSITRPPVVREPLVVVPGDPLASRPVYDPTVGRPLNFPARVLNNSLPAYPSGPGAQVMPFVNRTDKDKVVKEAFFYVKNAGRPLIPGVAIPAYELRFMSEQYDMQRKCYVRPVDDLVLPANSETRIVVRVVDTILAGDRMYGALVLRCADGELIQFETSQIIVQPD
jgi:hypothetical protein